MELTAEQATKKWIGCFMSAFVAYEKKHDPAKLNKQLSACYASQLPHLETVTLFLRAAQMFADASDEQARQIVLGILRENGINADESSLPPLPESPAPLSTTKPRTPEECCQPISAILALEDDDLLCALSEHLQELSADGDCLEALNPYEKTVFYANELCTEVHSGGFESYLYYRGDHFPCAVVALEEIGAHQTQALARAVSAKFPRKCVPKKLDSIQNALDRMAEKDVDFEAEDEIFYTDAATELLDKLLAYVLLHRTQFH